MAIHKSKSKIRFQGRTYHRNVSDGTDVEQQERYPGSFAELHGVPVPRRVHFELPSDDSKYKVAAVKPIPFVKEHVSSTEDMAAQGAYGSLISQSLRFDKIASKPAVCSATPVDNSREDLVASIRAFPLNDTPAKNTGDNRSPTPQVAPSETTRSTSPPSSSHKLLTLFAGKKKPKTEPNTPSHLPSHTSPAPTSIGCKAQTVFTSLADIPLAPTEQIRDPQHCPSKPLPFAEPRLTFSMVIPSVPIPGRERLNKLPPVNSVEPAPYHTLHGWATVTRDVFEPEIVQKGFEVAHRPEAPCKKTVVGRDSDKDLKMVRCCGISEGNFIDRAGGLWCSWHLKHPHGLY